MEGHAVSPTLTFRSPGSTIRVKRDLCPACFHTGTAVKASMRSHALNFTAHANDATQLSS